MIPDAPKPLILGLFASLALNLFLGGMLLANHWSQEPPPAAMGRGGALMMGRGMLTAGNGQIVGEQVWAKHGTAIHAAMQQIHQARAQVNQDLAREPWNEIAVAAALEQVRHRTLEAQVLWHKALMETAAQLPPEERSHLLEPPRGRRHRANHQP